MAATDQNDLIEIDDSDDASSDEEELIWPTDDATILLKQLRSTGLNLEILNHCIDACTQIIKDHEK